MIRYQILYWHDIPVQVRAGRRKGRVSKELPKRFQIAIDNAAMAGNLTGTDGYLDAFTWSPYQERDGSTEDVATAVAQELEQQYPKIDWRKTAELIIKQQAENNE